MKTINIILVLLLLTMTSCITTDTTNTSFSLNRDSSGAIQSIDLKSGKDTELSNFQYQKDGTIISFDKYNSKTNPKSIQAETDGEAKVIKSAIEGTTGGVTDKILDRVAPGSKIFKR